MGRRQDPEYPPPRPEDRRHMLDDCHFLAATADELAAKSLTDTGFVGALKKRFVPPSNQDSPAMREFRAAGFKGRFNDDKSSYNQVRHFVGAFSNAYYGGLAASLANVSFGNAVTEAVKQALKREGPTEYADKRLSATTVPQGVALAYGLSSRKDLGNFIRNNICGTSW